MIRDPTIKGPTRYRDFKNERSGGQVRLTMANSSFGAQCRYLLTDRNEWMESNSTECYSVNMVTALPPLLYLSCEALIQFQMVKMERLASVRVLSQWWIDKLLGHSRAILTRLGSHEAHLERGPPEALWTSYEAWEDVSLHSTDLARRRRFYSDSKQMTESASSIAVHSSFTEGSLVSKTDSLNGVLLGWFILIIIWPLYVSRM